MKRDQLTALEQTLEFLFKEEGKSHQGYFSNGWAGQQLAGLRDQAKDLIELARDGERLRALLELAGFHQDGSDQPVTLHQDDATMTCFISVGGMVKTRYFVERGGFRAAIDEYINQRPKDVT